MIVHHSAVEWFPIVGHHHELHIEPAVGLWGRRIRPESRVILNHALVRSLPLGLAFAVGVFNDIRESVIYLVIETPKASAGCFSNDEELVDYSIALFLEATDASRQWVNVTQVVK
jgi:hypothetical protein